MVPPLMLAAALWSATAFAQAGSAAPVVPTTAAPTKNEAKNEAKAEPKVAGSAAAAPRPANEGKAPGTATSTTASSEAKTDALAAPTEEDAEAARKHREEVNSHFSEDGELSGD